jgi:DHA2 family multidrug resistance protein-like MFS transporter
MAPWPLGVAIAAPLAGTLAERHSVALLGSTGLAVLAGGLALLFFLPADPAPLDIAWRMLVCGLGFGFFQTPNSIAIMSSAPAERSGGASAVQSAARLFGQTCGAALVAMILGLAAERGSTLAILIAIGFALLACVFSLLRAFAAPRAEAAE